MNIFIEVIGYTGMAVLLISMLFSGKKFRILNGIGCALSIAYGFLTTTIPTAVLNIGILTIDAVKIVLMVRKEHKEKDINK